MKEACVAYLGKKITLEWYFNTQEKSEALEYFESLTLDRQKKVVHRKTGFYASFLTDQN